MAIITISKGDTAIREVRSREDAPITIYPDDTEITVIISGQKAPLAHIRADCAKIEGGILALFGRDGDLITVIFIKKEV